MYAWLDEAVGDQGDPYIVEVIDDDLEWEVDPEGPAPDPALRPYRDKDGVAHWPT